MNDKDKLKSISRERLRRLVDETHKPLAQINRELGVDKDYVGRNYNGNVAITVEGCVRYAKYFNVTTDYLLGLTDVKEPPTSDEDKTLRTICDSTGLTRTAAEVLLYNRRRPGYLPVLGEILSNYICSPYRKRVRSILSRLQLAADDEPLTDEQRAAALNGILYVLAQFLQTAIEGSIELPY